MGKSKSGASEPLLPRPDGDAVSLHTQNGDDYAAGSSSHDGGRRRGGGYLDDIDDDAPELLIDGDEMPPLYSDIAPAAPAVLAGMDIAPDDDDDDDADDDNDAGSDGDAPATGTAIGADGRPIRAPAHILSHTASQGAPQRRRTCIDRSLDSNAECLLQNIELWGRRPPRPFVRLRGTHTHTEARRGADGKTRDEASEVVDFDVRVELTPLLYADARRHAAWRTQRVVRNYERVRRGTVLRRRGPQYRSHADPEAAPAQEPSPDLAEWCRRYCDPAAPALRVFSVSRRMVGFDAKKVRTHLEKLVRQTNYRGRLAITFPTEEEGVDIYSDHLFNRWRRNRWIRLLFFVTGLFLVAWPYLFFTTKRYEVVSFDWAFSRMATDANGAPTNRVEYVSLSEDQWYNLWARAINKAVLDKRQKTLDQEDLRAAEGAQPTFQSTGNNTVDGALDIVQASLNAMNQVNRYIGWGGDC